MRVSSRRLLPNEQKELVGELCMAIASIGTLDNAVRFVVDLFSKQEIAMLAKRLKIAKLLLEGNKYQEIGNRLKVGTATIARIRVWLDEGGSGFRFVYKKTRNTKNPLARIFTDTMEGRSSVKPGILYNWPGVLLEEIVKTANQRQRKRLLRVLEDIPKKQKIHRELIELFQTKS